MLLKFSLDKSFMAYLLAPTTDVGIQFDEWVCCDSLPKNVGLKAISDSRFAMA